MFRATDLRLQSKLYGSVLIMGREKEEGHLLSGLISRGLVIKLVITC